MILTREPLLTYVKILKDTGHTIITTNGCFDIIHIGHVYYLGLAKYYGEDPSKNVLIVLINSDKSTRANKGDKRPLVPELERAQIIDSLAFVNCVVLFDELTPISLLTELRPHIHIKGGDYIPEDMLETEAVRAVGGTVVTLGLVTGKSTTELINLILQRYGGEDH